MSRRDKPTPGTLGDVAPGDWATLDDGDAMVCWHYGNLTVVQRSGTVARVTVSGGLPVTHVRKRERAPVQGGEVDPLRRES